METAEKAVDIAGKTAKGAMDVTGKVAEGALDVTGKSVQAATALTGQAITAASVLGGDTINAAQKIGSAATQATAKLGTAGLSSTADIGTAALKTTTQATTDVLNAAEKITTAATGAAADIASTSLTSTASVTTGTIGQVEGNLNEAIKFAGNTSQRVFRGLENVSEIVSNAGRNLAEKRKQVQEAEYVAIKAAEMKTLKEQLDKLFKGVQADMMATVKTIHGVQKTTLAGQMNIYKRAKCGFFRRVAGFCDTGTLKKDAMRMDLLLNELVEKISAAGSEAMGKIQALESPEGYKPIETAYAFTSTSAITAFVAECKRIFEEYTNRTRKALGLSGGRKKKRRTYRLKKNHRRASRKRRVGL